MALFNVAGRALSGTWGVALVVILGLGGCRPAAPGASAGAPSLAYQVVRSYPHDPRSFTQGLDFDQGALFEGTGNYGGTRIKKVDLATGNTLQQRSVPVQYFGEGITVFSNRIYQLTWKEHLGFIYDRDTFELLDEFHLPGEGWGLTHDGTRLILSDGTDRLHFMNPRDGSITGGVSVRDAGQPVTHLNELEYVDGVIYANVWPTDRIARIDPATGAVTGWLDLAGLLKLPAGQPADVDVLNGMAYDPGSRHLFVTGKYWPYLYEISLAPAPAPTAGSPQPRD